MTLIEWKKVRLDDVAEVIGGGTPSTKHSEYWNGNISWITPKDLSGYNKRYISKGERSITDAGLANSSTRILPKNTVLLTSRAPIGYVAIASNELCTNQGFKSLVLKEGNCPEFFYYLLKHNKEYIVNMSSGSTFAEISGTQVKNLEFYIPEQEQQEKIAKILSDFDEKIELNDEININLEQQARSIYLSYFANKSPNGKLSDILHEMPKSKIKVGDAKGVRGIYPFFTSGQAVLEWNEYLVDGRYIYINTGGNAGVDFYIGKASYSTDTWCISTKNKMTDMLYLMLSGMLEELNFAYFEGSALKHLQKQKLKEKELYIPTEEELTEFNNLIMPIFDKISENKSENKMLTELRDTLLPKLMSGELEV